MSSEVSQTLGPIVTLLGAAVIAVPLFRKLGLGSVLAYFAAGLLVGPSGVAWFTDPQAILHVSELGVVMFLFIIGLEMRVAARALRVKERLAGRDQIGVEPFRNGAVVADDGTRRASLGWNLGEVVVIARVSQEQDVAVAFSSLRLKRGG